MPSFGGDDADITLKNLPLVYLVVEINLKNYLIALKLDLRKQPGST